MVSSSQISSAAPSVQPPTKTDDGRQVRVALEYGGTFWIDDDAVRPEDFPAAMQNVAEDRSDWKVVIKGDARLSFGQVRQAMLAVEAAMRLYAERLGEDTDLWGLAGLLHDFDWERHPSLERHPAEGAPILRERGCPEEVVQAILSHNTAGTGVESMSEPAPILQVDVRWTNSLGTVSTASVQSLKAEL